jgi:DNA-binding NtrC family response regulator
MARRIQTVLIVDDDLVLLRAWKRSLADRTLMTASTGLEARELARAHSVELAIVDLYLGGEYGIEVLRELKSIAPRATLIALSGNFDLRAAHQAGQLQAQFCLKPVDPKRLVSCVENDDSLRGIESVSPDSQTIAAVKRKHIERTLRDQDNNITHAADALGYTRDGLRGVLKKEGITVKRPKP